MNEMCQNVFVAKNGKNHVHLLERQRKVHCKQIASSQYDFDWGNPIDMVNLQASNLTQENC